MLQNNKSDEAKCFKCGSLTYKYRTFGKEHLDEPKVICASCAKSWHKVFAKKLSPVISRGIIREEYRKLWNKVFLEWAKGEWSVS